MEKIWIKAVLQPFYSIKERKEELVQCVFATLFVAIGVSIYVDCQLGSDSVTVFLDGVYRTTQIPISIIDQILTIILFIIAYFLNKKHIGICTIIHTLLIGVCIKIANIFISPLELYNYSFFIRCVFVIIAQLCFAFGFAFMQNFQSGMSTADAFIYGITEKTKLSYVQVHFLFDSFYFIVGFMLGGIIGIGSIFYVLTSGLLTYQAKKIIDKYEKRN